MENYRIKIFTSETSSCACNCQLPRPGCGVIKLRIGIEKVCKILTFFEQATKMMSEGDASISLSIPVVTTIMVSSNNKKGQDLGVIQLKNDLSDAMDRRFICLVSY